jgi:hydrogenase maturation protein HypF
LDAFSLFAVQPMRDVTTVRQLIAHRLRAPLAHGVGRYFDGIAALALSRPRVRFEGQLAMEWDAITDPTEGERYGYEIDKSDSPWSIDLRQMVADVVRDLLVGLPASVVAARFHNTLIEVTVDVVRGILRERGKFPVVLTGGCFQNARLAERIATSLSPYTAVSLHKRVPPGDGGIALGQAVIAGAIARR